MSNRKSRKGIRAKHKQAGQQWLTGRELRSYLERDGVQRPGGGHGSPRRCAALKTPRQSSFPTL